MLNQLSAAMAVVVAASSSFALPLMAAEFTEAQLSALLENPRLKQIDLPFLESPAPDLTRFVTMSDGVKLAVSVYFPHDFDPTTQVAPAVFEDSIYGRVEDAGTTAIRLYQKAGYIVLIGDARGFAASFGSQQGFNTTQQTADEAAVIAWIASEPWSNGNVAAIGHSVSAVFSDSMTSTGAPALRAAIIRAGDFDEYEHNMFPGGAPNLSILALAKELMEWHAGADCSANLETCSQLGFTPVEGDVSLLQSAIRDHAGNLESGVFAGLTYRDDGLGGMTLGASGAIARIEGIRAASVPARLSASWVDGVTALGALTRFTMAPDVPMELVIGATTHAGGLDADPFSTTPFAPAVPSAEEQFAADIDFLDRTLAGDAVTRSIHYQVLGSDVWKTTGTWPPIGVATETVLLSPDGLSAVAGERTELRYTVDPLTTSGKFNRWAAQRGGPIFYGDRSDAPGQRLSFDAAAITSDQELVGSPELCLVMQTDQTDGLVIAYLEDVAPDGRVTYLTEGMLRLIHRKTASTSCDPEPGVHRSFNRADGEPVTPGETMQIELPLLPVAALIRAGHHLRLSLAGADAGWFEDLTEVPANWTVSFGGDHPSSITLPLRSWR